MIEPHHAIQELVKTTLEILPAQVVISSSVEGCLSLSERNPPSIVITEIDLRGDNDGLTLCRHFKQLNIPVIILTAQTQLWDEAAADAAGADAFLSKPFSPSELLVLTMHLIDSSHIHPQSVS